LIYPFLAGSKLDIRFEQLPNHLTKYKSNTHTIIEGKGSLDNGNLDNLDNGFSNKIIEGKGSFDDP
jgi:hypothetical protein